MLESPVDLVKRLPSTVRLLLLGTLINKIGTFVVPYLTLVLTQKFHMSAAQAGVLVSSYGVGSLVSLLAGGIITDSLGRRVALLLSLGGSGGLAIAMAFAPSVRAFVALLVAFGFLAELYRPASQAIISDLLPSRDRAIGYAALRVVVNLGFALGMAVGGLVVDWSWRVLFVADGTTTILFAAVVFFLIHETKPGADMASLPGGGETPPIWRDLVFGQALVTSLVFSFVVFTFLTVLPLTVTEWAGYPAAIYGAVVAINGVLIAVFEVSMVAFLQRFRRLRVAACGLVLSGVGFGLTGLAPHWASFLVAIAVWTFGEMMTLPQQMSFLSDWAPPAARGKYLGLYSATWSVGFALNPVVMLPLHAWAGERLFWSFMFLLLAPAAFVPWHLDRTADRPELLRGRSEGAPAAGGSATQVVVTAEQPS